MGMGRFTEAPLFFFGRERMFEELALMRVKHPCNTRGVLPKVDLQNQYT